MKRSSVSAFLASLLILLFSLVTVQPSHAQANISLFDAYPRRGGLGDTVSMLLRGTGFESIKNLDGVFFGATQLRDLEFKVLSNELIEVLVLIPENAEVGPNEIRFVFDDNAYDAFFEVTEGGEGWISPVVAGLYPQEGQVDTEMSVFFELSYYYQTGITLIPRYEWGEFITMIIGDVEVQVNAITINDPGDLFEYRIYLPLEMRTGDTEIHLYYENYSYRDYFYVEPSPEPTPIMYGYSPNEWPADSDIEFNLEGDNLFQLGNLNRVEIAGMEVPFEDGGQPSNQEAVVGAYLPPELPLGETKIVFYYDNYVYEDGFFVVEGEAPRPYIGGISPIEGQMDSEVEIVLEGENLYELGTLNGVEIAGRRVEVLDNWEESNQMAVVRVYLPGDLPEGMHGIVFYYENYGYEASFLVRPPIGGETETVFYGLSPREGDVDTDFDLYLDGENLYELGDLEGVSVGGVDLEVWDYDFQSNQRLWVYVYMPEETPRNSQRITFYFENGEHSDSFVVNGPTGGIPPEILILIIGGVVVLGGMGVTSVVLIRRAIKKTKIEREDRQPDKRLNIKVEYKKDVGRQDVHPDRSSLTLDIDLEFEVKSDPGEQNIYTEGHHLIADD
jgi:hypothetical protein